MRRSIRRLPGLAATLCCIASALASVLATPAAAGVRHLFARPADDVSGFGFDVAIACDRRPRFQPGLPGATASHRGAVAPGLVHDHCLHGECVSALREPKQIDARGQRASRCQVHDVAAGAQPTALTRADTAAADVQQLQRRGSFRRQDE